MDQTYIRGYVIGPALALLSKHDVRSDERAVQLLAAIGWQESRFEHRQQIRGPAIGFWQNEQIFVVDIMTRPRSRIIMLDVLDTLHLPTDTATLHQAIRYHDVAACCLARLALWLDVRPLPGPGDSADGWHYYVRNWRPGKPKPNTWLDAWEYGSALVRA